MSPALNCRISAASTRFVMPSRFASPRLWHGKAGVNPAANCRIRAASRGLTTPSQLVSPAVDSGVGDSGRGGIGVDAALRVAVAVDIGAFVVTVVVGSGETV